MSSQITIFPDQVQFSYIGKTTDNEFKCSSEVFESRCLSEKTVHEVILSNTYVKMYFDADYKNTENFDEFDIYLANNILRLNKLYIRKFCLEVVGVEPIFAVAESHYKSRMIEGIEHWAYSFHIVVSNIILPDKQQVKNIVKELNDVIKKDQLTYSLITNGDRYDEYITGGIKEAFDPAPYGKGIQKFRCVHSSKDGENRPFKLIEGTFNDTVLTCNFPLEAVLYTPPTIEYIPTTNTKYSSSDIDGDKKYDMLFAHKSYDLKNMENESREFDTWRKHGLFIKGYFGDTKEAYELFDKFSQMGGKSYNEYENKERWDGFVVNGDVYNNFGIFVNGAKNYDKKKCKIVQDEINILKKNEDKQMKKQAIMDANTQIKIDSCKDKEKKKDKKKDKKEEITDELLNEYYNPKFGTIETIIETSQFVSQEGTPYEKDIESDHKIIIIKADLGAGKSTAIKRILPKYQSVLIITPRIAYCKHAVKEFNVSSYLDGDLDVPMLACSIESFYKIPDYREYECVILDECEAILSVFSSPTLQGRQLITYNKLNDIIQNSKKVIFAGAFITQKTIDFIESFKTPSLLIRNDRINIRKQAIEIDPRIFNLKLIKYLQNGGKPYVYWDSKKQAETFVAELKGASLFDDMLKKMYDKMIFYNSDSDDIIFQGLENINDVWDKASFVMATPSITVGNSYSPPKTTFTSVWIFAFPSCIVADTMQGHKRVRHTTTGNLYYSIPDDTILTFLGNCRGETISSLGAFDEITTDKREVIVSHAKKQLAKEVSKGEHNEQYTSIIKAMTTEYEITPQPLRNLLFLNLLENDLSAKYFKKMFLHFLDICGYDVIYSTRDESQQFINTPEEEKEIELLRDNGIGEHTPYEHIYHITEDKMKEIKKKISKKDATRKEKMQVQKYYFESYIDNKELSNENKSDYFKVFNDSQTHHLLMNLYNEANHNASYPYIKEFEGKKSSIETVKLESIKLSIIRDINKRLGLKNSLDTKKITREEMESLGEYIKQERDNINKVFKFIDKTKNNIASVKSTEIMLIKIYKSWFGGMFLNNSDKKSKRPATAFWIHSNFHENPPFEFKINDSDVIGLNPTLLQSFNQEE
jgi:hypothetical protein